MSTLVRPSFFKRAWPALAVLVSIFGGYTLALALLGKLPEFLDHLDALSGVAVAFLTLVLVWIEHGRDLRDEFQDQQHQSRVDQRVSSTSFLISRQLTNWRAEIATLGAAGSSFIDAISILGEIEDDAYDRSIKPLFEWWSQKTKDQDDAERRFEEVVAILPEASPEVAEAVRYAFVKFEDFASRWNESTMLWNKGKRPDWKEIVMGLKSLQAAADRLDTAIDVELRRTRDELIPVDSPIHRLAEALEKAATSGKPIVVDGGQSLSPGEQ